MRYNSPLIVSTSSLNPSFGYGQAVALWLSPSWAAGICIVAGVALVILVFPVPIVLAVGIALVIVYTHAWLKATYVRPEAFID